MVTVHPLKAVTVLHNLGLFQRYMDSDFEEIAVGQSAADSKKSVNGSFRTPDQFGRLHNTMGQNDSVLLIKIG
ncbi:MAG: hypothetical protein KBG20_14555 [Caldilineaceae bacterium]|nr:hypothetical protein [Caldilineaceae bacterium]MBP8108367.1 hypothetical protein [Caldilineaceae bacterium]MBP8123292.1 hypothetical protein [Caldilineaceae bacterium]MBP9073524.1 hypothetical protein [Caldilineaceae bacterium]